MMNDFGEMSETGVVLSNSEMRERRLKRGECPTCGMKCFKKTLFKSTPITEDGKVLNGRCLVCHPLDASEMTSQPVTAQVEIASSKDLHRANRSMGTLHLGSQSKIPRRGLSRRAVSDGNVNDSAASISDTSTTTSSSSLRHSISSHSTKCSTISMQSVQEEVREDLHRQEYASAGKHVRKDSMTMAANQVGTPPGSQNKRDFLPSPPRSDDNDASKSDTLRQNTIAMAASLHLQRNFRKMKEQLKDQSSTAIAEEPTYSPQENRSRWEITKGDSLRSTGSSGSRRSNASFKGGKTAAPLDEAQAIQMLEGPNCTFSDIFDIVQDFTNVDSVEGIALKVMAEDTVKILAEPETQMLLDKEAAGVKFVLSKLRSDSIDIAQSACNVLFNITSVHVIKKAIVNNGGVECISGNFERFANNIEMQKLSLNCLDRLGDIGESYFYMLCEGVDAHIIDAMARNSEHIELQKCCCDIIVKLSRDPSLRTGLLEANGAGQLAITMIMFSDHLDLLDKALRALRSLCHESTDNKKSIADSGAIDSIVSTMQKHRDDAKIQAAAARTLGEIGSTDDAALIVGQCGGIDVITRAIYVHQKRQSVTKRCCAALENLSNPNDNRLLMVEIGVIGALIHTMQSHPDNVDIQILCFNVLSNLSEGGGRTEVIKKKIVDQEALDSISMSMVMHGSDVKLQEAACSLLCNLVCEANYEALLAGGATELMKVASEKFYACRGSMDYMTMMLDRIRR